MRIGLLIFILLSLTAAQPSFTAHTITTDANGAHSVYAVDMDSDGDMDVLSASKEDDKIAWYENNGSEIFTAHTITTSANGARSVYAIDMDSDGDMDVLSAITGNNKIAWYENDGSESFTAHTITTNTGYPFSVYAIDMDSDGDMDVLSASYTDHKIAWYENDGSESFTAHTITTLAQGALSVYATDMDSDGDMDVLSASGVNKKIAWYENNGSESFTAHTIATGATAGDYSVYAIDMDSDGDMDVLSAYNDLDKIAWYENNGSESFTAHTITTDANGAQSVYATDMDSDGDMDVLSASASDNKIAWYENNGSESFAAHTITTDANSARSVYAADIDSDGHMDVLSASYSDKKIAWYRNGGKVPTMTIATTLEVTPEVTSFAGSGSYGSDDGTGTAASFTALSSVAVDASGNVYVADNDLIRKITSDGVVTTFAGSGSEGSDDGTGTASSFKNLHGVAVDGNGNVYVADTDNHLIRKITSAGVVTTFAGSGSEGSDDGTGTAASFKAPTSVAVDASGNVYVADNDNHLIRKITPAGVVTTLAGSYYGSADGTGTAASFKYPTGVAVDASGNVYVADKFNNKIRKITPAGVVTTLAGSGSNGSANGTGSAASFKRPTGVAVDVSGNVYVADRGNNLIRKITSAGVVTTLAGSGSYGSDNGTGTAASFKYPYGVAVDGIGNIYVADENNLEIRKIATTLTSGSTTNDATLPLIFTSSKPTTNFTVGDISVTNGSLSSFNPSSSTVYSATFTPAANGAVTINVPAGSFTDDAGNDNTAATEFNWTYDSTGPAMTISAVQGSDGFLSNDAALSLTFTGTEATNNFGVDDITVTNGSLSSFSQTSSTVYSATLTPSSDGAVTIDVAAGSFTDAVGNLNTSATQFNWTYDNIKPTMTISAVQGSDGFTSNDAVLSLTFTPNEATKDFDIVDISVTNGYLSSFTALNDTSSMATLTPLSSGAVTINVPADSFTDAAGNGNTAATFNWTYDSTKPEMTISAVQGSDGFLSNDPALSLTFTSTEATSNFVVGDITVTNGSLSSFSQTSSTVYTATLTPLSSGAVTINMADGAFTDAAGRGIQI